MFAYILRRLWQMLPTMAGVVVLVLIKNGSDPFFTCPKAGAVELKTGLTLVLKQF
jgi:hypothetical protein